MDKKKAWELLKEYNKEPFHIKHAQTVALCMRYFAEQLGYKDEADYWEVVGMLHDLDFGMYPEEHCTKVREILKENGYDDKFIYSVACHGYGLCSEL